MHLEGAIGEHDGEVWGLESVVGQPQLDPLELEPGHLAGVAPGVQCGGVGSLGLVHGKGKDTQKEQSANH